MTKQTQHWRKKKKKKSGTAYTKWQIHTALYTLYYLVHCKFEQMSYRKNRITFSSVGGRFLSCDGSIAGMRGGTPPIRAYTYKIRQSHEFNSPQFQKSKQVKLEILPRVKCHRVCAETPWGVAISSPAIRDAWFWADPRCPWRPFWVFPQILGFWFSETNGLGGKIGTF